MIDYINTSFTVEELSELNGTLDILDEWQFHVHFLNKNCNEIIVNGRLNHAMISKIIVQTSAGDFILGGQGNKEPDLYYEENDSGGRTEQKGFEKGSSVAWVAKSKFFAKNSGTKKLKEWLEEEKPSEEQKKNYMINESYSDDEFYLLTATAKWDGEIRPTVCFFVETKLLHQCLIEEYTKDKPYCYVDLQRLRLMTQTLTDKNKSLRQLAA